MRPVAQAHVPPQPLLPQLSPSQFGVQGAFGLLKPRRAASTGECAAVAVAVTAPMPSSDFTTLRRESGFPSRRARRSKFRSSMVEPSEFGEVGDSDFGCSMLNRS